MDGAHLDAFGERSEIVGDRADGHDELMRGNLVNSAPDAEVTHLAGVALSLASGSRLSDDATY